MEARPSFLIVDDDRLVRRSLERGLRARGIRVHAAASGEEALSLARAAPPDVAIVDLRMPGGSGLEVAAQLRRQHHAVRVVMLTAHASTESALEAGRIGVLRYLEKPASAEDILRALRGLPPSREGPLYDLTYSERECIERAIDASGGNISAAARLLGVHRRTLQRKLRRGP
jgi:two-component system response regulator RegA